MKRTIVCGGPAGLGPNFISNIVALALMEKGYYVFNSRDYESRIRGGHNFNLITFSDKPVASNNAKIDLLVALDAVSKTTHAPAMLPNAPIIEDSNNAVVLGKTCKVLGISFAEVNKILKTYPRYAENLKSAREGYNAEIRALNLAGNAKLVNSAARKSKSGAFKLQCGSEAVAQGASRSGLDFYYAYPMTPATGVLFELATNEAAANKAKNSSSYNTVELENEIAVVNGALGSAMTGASVMAGTSGGGFDLMTEALTLSGVAEIPIVFYLCQRPGPATGVATYTAQGDLALARHAGHGEFPRIVVAPGNPIEAEELTSELLALSKRYRVPSILLSDKHLADSYYTVSAAPAKLASSALAKTAKNVDPIVWPIRFNSYETDEHQIASSDAAIISKNVEARLAKGKKIAAQIETLSPISIFGKKSSKNIVLGWGSTQGAIIDAIDGLDCKFIQIKYVEPISRKIGPLLRSAKKVIIVENNATSQLSAVIAEKTGFVIADKNKILRYDGRPFFAEELAKQISRRIQ